MNIIGAVGEIPDIETMVGQISSLEKEHGSTIQVFRADRVFGRQHLERAVELAQRNWEGGNASAHTLGMEVMLFAAAERQIDLALEKLGVEKDTKEIAIVVIGDMNSELILSELGLSREDRVLGPQGKDHSIFAFTSEELAMADVHELVLERMALSQLTR